MTEDDNAFSEPNVTRINDDLVQMTPEDWWETYQPIVNEIDGTHGGFNIYDGDETRSHVFDFYNKDEVALLQETLEKEPGRVWTLLSYEDDTCEKLSIMNGYHHVNREGFYITKKPYEGEEKHMEIVVSDEREEYHLLINGVSVLDNPLGDIDDAELLLTAFLLHLDQNEAAAEYFDDDATIIIERRLYDFNMFDREENLYEATLEDAHFIYLLDRFNEEKDADFTEAEVTLKEEFADDVMSELGDRLDLTETFEFESIIEKLMNPEQASSKNKI